MNADKKTAKDEREKEAEAQRQKEAAMNAQQKKDEEERLAAEEEKRKQEEAEKNKAIDEVETTPVVDTDKTATISNWDGNIVTKNWYEQELLSIGGVAVTTGEVAIGSSVLLAVGIIMGLIVLFFAIRERNKIASGARRLSQFVKKQSVKLRQSIRRTMGYGEEEQDGDTSVDPELVQQQFRGNKSQK